jgi:hypothetical protein
MESFPEMGRFFFVVIFSVAIFYFTFFNFTIAVEGFTLILVFV